MGEDWKYYNVDDYNLWKRKQGANFKSPPQENYLVAANHIKSILDGKKLSWAAMCGLAMLCLGSRREMPDIHIVYDDRDFQRIKTKLEADKRISLPKGIIPLFPAKILIATGPKYKDSSCTENAEVEVDLVPTGINGAPTIESFRKNQVLLRLNLKGKMDNFRGLNILYLIKTTLQYCKSRELAWDPKEDLVFLCQNYASEIEKIRQHLHQKDIQELFLSTSSFARLSPENQRKCYLALLNREPPPIMSVTPPPPLPGSKTSNSANSADGNPPKPPLLSHKSSPAVSVGTRPSSTFLSPPLPGKPKSRHAQSPLTSPASNPTGPHAQLVPIYSATTDSRSRYRAISAPNTPNSNTNSNTQLNPANTARPLSADRPQNQQAANMFYSTARAVGIQNGPNLSRPHMVRVQAPAHASMSAQAMGGPISQKSMPNMKPSNSGLAPMPTKAQKIVPPGPRSSHIPTQSSSHAILSAGTASAERTQPRSTPTNGSKGLLNGAYQNDRARLPNASGAQPSNQGQASLPTHRPDQYRNHSTSIIKSSAPQKEAEVTPTNPAGLRLVGPEGVYRPPDKPIKTTFTTSTKVASETNGPRSTSMSASRLHTSNQTAFAFELDASPAQPAQRSLSPQELPSDPVLIKEPQSHVSQLTKISGNLQQEQRVSRSQPHPTGPPELAHLAHDVIAPQPSLTASSLAPNAQHESIPIEDLPTSLMAGGAARQRSPSRSPQRSAQSSPQLNPNLQGNASKYQIFHSPSSSPSNGQTALSNATASEYKAYSGPISHPVATPPNMQKEHILVAIPAITRNTMTISQDPAHIALNAQPVHSLFQTSNSLGGNRISPMSPPEKRDSHHSPRRPSMNMSSTDRNTVIGTTEATTLGYTAFSYQRQEELHMGPPEHVQPPRQQGDEVRFASYTTQGDQSQGQNQPLSQGEKQTQTQPLTTSQTAEPQISSPQSNIYNPQPNQQPNEPAPLQWTHPALQHRNHPLAQPQIQSHSTQTQHYPLSQENIALYNPPTTTLHQRNTSHDSDKLAQEYMSELPKFGELGYGSGSAYSSGDEEENVHRHGYGYTAKDVQTRDEQKVYVTRPEDGWKRDSGRGHGEGNGNGGKRISELYEFIDFT